MLQFLMRYPNQWVAKSAFYNVNLHNPGRPKSMLVKHGYAIICKKCPTAWMYINDITVAREHMTDKQIKHYFVSKEQLNYVTNNTDPVLFDQS